MSLPRSLNTSEINLGKVLLFCEGRTEENYFNYFATIIQNNKNKYATLEVVCVCAEGNAQRVLNFAEDFLLIESNAALYQDHEKWLIFDCDEPQNIDVVIREMAQKGRYGLLLTNYLFEIWLLMHFEYIIVRTKLRKINIYKRLASALNISKHGDSEKNDVGLIRKIIGNGASVRFAIENAERLRSAYFPDDNESECVFADRINELNPYTRVDLLVNKILIEIAKY